MRGHARGIIAIGDEPLACSRSAATPAASSRLAASPPGSSASADSPSDSSAPSAGWRSAPSPSAVRPSGWAEYRRRRQHRGLLRLRRRVDDPARHLDGAALAGRQRAVHPVRPPSRLLRARKTSGDQRLPDLPGLCDTARATGVRLMSQMTLLVNGRTHTVDVDPATPLLFVLSDDLALKGPKFGCGLGQCGACTVIVRGQAIRSCVTPVETVQNDRDHHARRPGHDRAATPDSAGVHRRAGVAVRLLPERRHPGRQGARRSHAGAHRRRHRPRPRGRAVPLLRPQPDAPRHPPLRGGEAGVTPRLTSDARRALGGGRPRPAPLPAAVRRAGRGLWRRALRRPRAVALGAGDQRPQLHGARCVDRHHRRQPRARLHRQVRARDRASSPRRCSSWPRSSTCRSSRVTLTMCDTAATPDQGTTSGAQSHPANFNHANLALACATAREALVRLASERLSAPVSRTWPRPTAPCS